LSTIKRLRIFLAEHPQGMACLPIVFGERRRLRIEEAFNGEWKFTTVEMVKRDGE
jgi:hypothetical protein